MDSAILVAFEMCRLMNTTVCQLGYACDKAVVDLTLSKLFERKAYFR